VIATKLGFISNYGWESEVDVHQATGSQPGAGDLVTLFAKHTDAASSASVLVGDPFAVAYMSTGAVKNPFAVYSEDPAWNTGSAANKLYNHVKAYQVTSGTYAGVYFLGLEDWSYENTGAKHRRFDWNDTVVQMSVEAVPEPAFYQIAVLIGLGSIGFVRRAVRRT